MNNYNSSLGKEILEKGTGKLIALISDIVFDTEKGHIRGIITNTGKVLLFEDIADWKIKIYIKSDVFIQEVKDASNIESILNEEISILGNKVVSDDGSMLGYCNNIYFNEKTGDIIKISVKKYLFGIIPLKKHLISSTQILQIKKDQILVKSTLIKGAVPET